MVDFKAVLHRQSILRCALLTCAIVAFIQGRTLDEKEWLRRNERECSQAGGLCIVRTYCEEAYRRNETGLCPEQEPDAVCCHKVPEEASCRWHGGDCVEYECNELTYRGQKDCPEGTKCCLLF